MPFNKNHRFSSHLSSLCPAARRKLPRLCWSHCPASSYTELGWLEHRLRCLLRTQKAVLRRQMWWASCAQIHTHLRLTASYMGEKWEGNLPEEDAVPAAPPQRFSPCWKGKRALLPSRPTLPTSRRGELDRSWVCKLGLHSWGRCLLLSPTQGVQGTASERCEGWAHLLLLCSTKGWRVGEQRAPVGIQPRMLPPAVAGRTQLGTTAGGNRAQYDTEALSFLCSYFLNALKWFWCTNEREIRHVICA